MMKTFLISGAGSGIGRAIAQTLAKDEYSLILLGRNSENLEETKSKLLNANSHHVISADIRDPRALHKAFAEINLNNRNLTGVIANSGVGGENEYGPNDRWKEVIDTNLYGTYALINEALPSLRATKGYRHIVIISSILARLGVPKYSAYCASKAGLLGLMRSMAAEFSHEKILVNAICPGWVETNMAKQGIELMAQASGKSYETVLKEQMSYVPLQKMSQPSEIAELVKYLVNPSQQSITGQSLDINGGALMP